MGEMRGHRHPEPAGRDAAPDSPMVYKPVPWIDPVAQPDRATAS